MTLNRRGFLGALLALPLVRRLPIAQPVVEYVEHTTFRAYDDFLAQPVVGGIDPATFQFWRNRETPDAAVWRQLVELAHDNPRRIGRLTDIT